MSRPSVRLRMAGGLVVAAVAALIGAAPALVAGAPAMAAPAGATAAPEAADDLLVPIVDCVQDAPLGAVTARTVVLGYRSAAAQPVTVPAGAGLNEVAPGAPDRGQPTVFLPGEHHGVALLTVDAQAEPALSWRLGGTTVRIDGTAPACTSATSVTLSVPATVASGRAFTVTAAVSRALLGAPDGGTVEFVLDDGEPVSAPLVAGSARVDLTAATTGDHRVSARYVPAEGSGLVGSTATGTLTSTAADGVLSIAANSVVAGSASATVVVSRTSAEGEARAEVVTGDGSAKAGVDYVATSATVTLPDGVTEATVSVPLLARPAGSPAATFFVLLQRSSTPVKAASATVLLPSTGVVAAPAGAGPSAGGALSSGRSDGPDAAGPSSALPAGDPTAVADAPAGQSLLLLLVGAAVTVGGALGVVSVVRATGGMHSSY